MAKLFLAILDLTNEHIWHLCREEYWKWHEPNIITYFYQAIGISSLILFWLYWTFIQCKQINIKKMCNIYMINTHERYFVFAVYLVLKKLCFYVDGQFLYCYLAFWIVGTAHCSASPLITMMYFVPMLQHSN